MSGRDDFDGVWYADFSATDVLFPPSEKFYYVTLAQLIGCSDCLATSPP